MGETKKIFALGINDRTPVEVVGLGSALLAMESKRLDDVEFMADFNTPTAARGP